MKRTVRRVAMLIAILVLLLSHAVIAQAATGDPELIVSDYYELVDALDSAEAGEVIGISGTITVPSPECLAFGCGDIGSRVILRRMSSEAQIVFISGGTGDSMVEKIRFDGNSAQAGGSKPFVVVKGKVNFENCEFRKCKNTNGSGGALLVDYGGAAYLNNCGFTGNVASNGAQIWSNGIVELNYCTLSGGKATNQGGGIYNSGTLTLNSSELSDNTAKMGGGIYSTGSVELNNSLVWNNLADVQGADILNKGTLNDNTTSEEYSSWLEGYELYYIGWELDSSGAGLKLIFSYEEPTHDPDPNPNPEPSPDPSPNPDPEEGGEDEPSEDKPTDPPVDPTPTPKPDEGDTEDNPTDPSTGDEESGGTEPTTPPEGGEVDPDPNNPPSEGDESGSENKPTDPAPTDPDIGGDNEGDEPPEGGGDTGEAQKPTDPTPIPEPSTDPEDGGGDIPPEGDMGGTTEPKPTEPPSEDTEQGGAEEPEDSPSDTPTPSPSPSHSHTPSPSTSDNSSTVSEPDPEPSPKEETKEELPESGGDPIIEDIPVEPSVAPQVVIEPVITREVVQAQGTPQKVPEPIETQEAEEVKLDPTQNIRIAAEGVELIYEYTDEGVIVRVKKSSESPPEAANEADEAPIPTRLSEAPTEVPRDSVNWVEVTTMIFMGGLLLLELVDKIKLLKKPKK